MRKITCPCEQVFKAEIPESVDLDKDPDCISKILDGTLLSCVCPTCNTELNLDVPLTVSWPSKKLTLIMVPELDRLSLISGSIKPKKNADYVVGYAELVDRVAVLRDGMEPTVVEAIKYHLLQKARETNPEKSPVVLYEKKGDNNELEFHIHGIRDKEIALTRLPFRVYESVLADWQSNPDKDDYTALKIGGYLSVRNILLEDSPDA